LQIDNTIQRFRQIKRSISEHLTVEKAKQVIADLEVQSAALHPTRTISVAAAVWRRLPAPRRSSPPGSSHHLGLGRQRVSIHSSFPIQQRSIALHPPGQARERHRHPKIEPSDRCAQSYPSSRPQLRCACLLATTALRRVPTRQNSVPGPHSSYGFPETLLTTIGGRRFLGISFNSKSILRGE